MRFALLVTSLGRQQETQRLLESLVAQSHTDFCVYMGDQSRGGLNALWRTFAGRLEMRVIPMESRGVSAARNALLRACRDDAWDVIAYPDDDCWYPAGLLEGLNAWFAGHPAADGLLTAWQTGPGALPAPVLPAKVTWLNAFRRGETYVQFYRRSAAGRIGPWDETLGPGTGLPYGSGEDTDYLLRAVQQGLQIFRENSLMVYHPAVSLRPESPERWQAYGRGRMRLLHIHHLPFWFRLANVVWPLWRMLQEHPRYWRYRRHMFYGRLQGWGEKSPAMRENISPYFCEQRSPER